MSALLEVRDLHVRFRVRGQLASLLQPGGVDWIDAVCGVSLEVDAGETYALVGESGSGKTTLARAIIGLVPAQEGSIHFEGRELRGLGERDYKPIRRDMAMMFQDPAGSLSPRLTVRALITEPFRIHDMTDRDLDAEAKRLLRLVGLPTHFTGRYPHQLSGGQARRVGVARALALNPKLILADEPTAGLDVSVQGEILNLLYRLQQELGIAILMVTHNLNVVRHTSHRMGIMYLGRLVETGPTESIFATPRHPYTHALLAANPEPDPDAELERIKLTGEIPSLLRRPTGCEFHTRCPLTKDDCRTRFPPWEGDDLRGHRCMFPLAG